MQKSYISYRKYVRVPYLSIRFITIQTIDFFYKEWRVVFKYDPVIPDRSPVKSRSILISLGLTLLWKVLHNEITWKILFSYKNLYNFAFVLFKKQPWGNGLLPLKQECKKVAYIWVGLLSITPVELQGKIQASL